MQSRMQQYVHGLARMSCCFNRLLILDVIDSCSLDSNQ